MSSRLRIIAGPNGSGKSSIFTKIKAYKENGRIIPTGPFVNSDIIEKELEQYRSITLSEYGILSASPTIIEDYLKISTLKAPYDPSIIRDFITIENNSLKLISESSPYLGMIVSDLIREELLKNSISFTMETVFSHIDKVNFMKRAIDLGYKVYLYFVSTGDFQINIDRVKGRVAEGGHDVPIDKIEQRYERTMNNLLPALDNCYRAYIFDNAGTDTILVAEQDRNGDITIGEKIPAWVIKYLGLSDFPLGH
jgi:predicted ABC-type ATPase